MHTRNPLLDQFAKISTAAVGVAQAAGEEAKAMARARTDRIAAELDLVRRDEYDVQSSMLDQLRAEHEALGAEVSALRAEVERLRGGSAG